MATAVIMPKQGQSVETCIITKWFKNKGESVSVGDILFSYETDKAAFDLESPAEGILLDVFFGEGAEVPVLVNVAVIGKSGEETDSFNPEHAALCSSCSQLLLLNLYSIRIPLKVQDIKNVTIILRFKNKDIAKGKTSG